MRDWSVRSDPIICWDVNYTVLSVHVKRQIIEEGKRCATFYLCSRLELLRASLFCFFFLSAVFLSASQNVGCVTPAELIIWQIYCFYWSVMSALLYLCARVHVLGTCIDLDSNLNWILVIFLLNLHAPPFFWSWGFTSGCNVITHNAFSATTKKDGKQKQGNGNIWRVLALHSRAKIPASFRALVWKHGEVRGRKKQQKPLKSFFFY